MGAFLELLLLSPAGLAAGLAALLAPLLVHLISRSRGQRVPIGDIELVRAARRRRISEPRITQWPLLALRLLLVALAALILGRAALPGQEDLRRDAVYLTPDWLAEAPADRRAAVLDRDDAELHVLAPGFPTPSEFGAVRAATSSADSWPLLAERLSVVRHLGAVEIHALGRLGEFGPRRPALPRPVDWRLLAPSDGPSPTPRPEPPALTVVTEPGAPLEAQVLRALDLLRKHRWPELDWRVADPATAGAVEAGGVELWLTSAPPATSASPADSGARVLWLNQHPWTELGAELPERLLEALLDPRSRAAAFADAPVEPEAPETEVASIAAAALPTRTLQPFLAMLLILLWGVERWLSERGGRPHG